MSLSDNDTCSSPMTQPQTRMVCCCSLGAGWGPDCDLCPRQETYSAEYTDLCGGGGPGKYSSLIE